MSECPLCSKGLAEIFCSQCEKSLCLDCDEIVHMQGVSPRDAHVRLGLPAVPSEHDILFFEVTEPKCKLYSPTPITSYSLISKLKNRLDFFQNLTLPDPEGGCFTFARAVFHRNTLIMSMFNGPKQRFFKPNEEGGVVSWATFHECNETLGPGFESELESCLGKRIFKSEEHESTTALVAEFLTWMEFCGRFFITFRLASSADPTRCTLQEAASSPEKRLTPPVRPIDLFNGRDSPIVHEMQPPSPPRLQDFDDLVSIVETPRGGQAPIYPIVLTKKEPVQQEEENLSGNAGEDTLLFFKVVVIEREGPFLSEEECMRNRFSTSVQESAVSAAPVVEKLKERLRYLQRYHIKDREDGQLLSFISGEFLQNSFFLWMKPESGNREARVYKQSDRLDPKGRSLFTYATEAEHALLSSQDNHLWTGKHVWLRNTSRTEAKFVSTVEMKGKFFLAYRSPTAVLPQFARLRGGDASAPPATPKFHLNLPPAPSLSPLPEASSKSSCGTGPLNSDRSSGAARDTDVAAVFESPLRTFSAVDEPAAPRSAVKFQETAIDIAGAPADAPTPNPSVTTEYARSMSSKDTRNSIEVKRLGRQSAFDEQKEEVHKLGSIVGVLIPTCENMWGVLIFLRFYYIVAEAGVGLAIVVVLLSFSAAFFTVCSLSAMATSGFATGGGPYFMISRALGPELGGAVGIMYFLAIMFLSVLEVLGATEMFISSQWVPMDLVLNPWYKQLVASIIMISLVLMVFAGMKFVSKLGVVFLGVVLLTMLSYYIGLATAPSQDCIRDVQCNGVTGLSLDTLRANWGPSFSEGVDFSTVLSVFFPCFTGILSGANRSAFLVDPQVNLPRGTFGAIIFSCFMYLSYMLLWGSVASRDYLKGLDFVASDSGAHHARHLLAGAGESAGIIISHIAWPVKYVAQVGVIVSSMSQALQCLIVAPRLLQMIAKDNVIPVMAPLAVLRKNEPARALFATYILGGGFCLLGSLDVVAPILTMCFLLAYTTMNFAVFLLSVMRNPSWRPHKIHMRRWQLLYCGLSLSGFIICLVIMFIVSWYWALASLFIAFLVFCYINYKGVTATWGSGVDGLLHQIAIRSLLGMQGSMDHTVNWRPQLLCLYKLHPLRGYQHDEILSTAQQLRKGRGLCIVAAVIEGEVAESAERMLVEKSIIEEHMGRHQLSGFAEVVVAKSFAEGKKAIVQLAGLGGLRPNTVLIGWPKLWSGDPSNAREFCDTVCMCSAQDQAVLVLKGIQCYPDDFAPKGTLDLWWILYDGGLLLLTAYLLQQSKQWRNCSLRLFTVAEDESKTGPMKAKLENVLYKVRIKAEVFVLVQDADALCPYTYDFAEREDIVRERVVSVRKEGRERSNSLLELSDIVHSMTSPAAAPGSPVPAGRARLNSFRPPELQTLDEESAVESSPLDEDGEEDGLTRPRGNSFRARANSYRPRVPSVQLAAALGHLDTERSSGAGPDAQMAKIRQSFIQFNQKIVEMSASAQMVLINMPDPENLMEKEDVMYYMEYMESLTSGLDRVMLVHGTGKEHIDLNV